MRGIFLISFISSIFALSAPGFSATLNVVSAGGFTILDGTSNTLQFGETSRASVCVQGATGQVSDGTSNTILFGESGGFTLVGALLQAFGPVSEILDGSSNTIFLSEGPVANFCLVGGQIDKVVSGPPLVNSGGTVVIGDGAVLDLCLSSVNRLSGLTDGTSNTVLLGETYCTTDLRLGSDAVIDAADTAPVPLPPAMALMMMGLGILFAWRRRIARPEHVGLG